MRVGDAHWQGLAPDGYRNNDSTNKKITYNCNQELVLLRKPGSTYLVLVQVDYSEREMIHYIIHIISYALYYIICIVS